MKAAKTVFATVLMMGVMAQGQTKRLDRNDNNLKASRPVACPMRAALSLGDCTDASCMAKGAGAAKKAIGTDGIKKGG